jgi:IS5 family transposase
VRPIVNALLKNYTVDATVEGADDFPPLMLMKAFLLQKWFRINSDPELENQINDRIFFKNFLGLSFNRHYPDNSTFSPFRGRLSKEAMNMINNLVLQQFSQKGLSINDFYR